MKSTSSFTWLPDFGLYCSSKNFFMMRVGGQSGTAIVSVTSSARANVALPANSEAARPAAINELLIFLFIIIVRSPPSVIFLILLLALRVRLSPGRSKRGRRGICLDRERPRPAGRGSGRMRRIPTAPGGASVHLPPPKPHDRVPTVEAWQVRP